MANDVITNMLADLDENFDEISNEEIVSLLEFLAKHDSDGDYILSALSICSEKEREGLFDIIDVNKYIKKISKKNNSNQCLVTIVTKPHLFQYVDYKLLAELIISKNKCDDFLIDELSKWPDNNPGKQIIIDFLLNRDPDGYGIYVLGKLDKKVTGYSRDQLLDMLISYPRNAHVLLSALLDWKEDYDINKMFRYLIKRDRHSSNDIIVALEEKPYLINNDNRDLLIEAVTLKSLIGNNIVQLGKYLDFRSKDEMYYLLQNLLEKAESEYYIVQCGVEWKWMVPYQNEVFQWLWETLGKRINANMVYNIGLSWTNVDKEKVLDILISIKAYDSVTYAAGSWDLDPAIRKRIFSKIVTVIDEEYFHIRQFINSLLYILYHYSDNDYITIINKLIDKCNIPANLSIIFSELYQSINKEVVGLYDKVLDKLIKLDKHGIGLSNIIRDTRNINNKIANKLIEAMLSLPDVSLKYLHYAVAKSSISYSKDIYLRIFEKIVNNDPDGEIIYYIGTDWPDQILNSISNRKMLFKILEDKYKNTKYYKLAQMEWF